MDEDKLKAVIEGIINRAVEPVNQRLDGIEGRLGDIEGELNNPDDGLHAIKSKLDAASSSVITIEQKINAYGDMYKINDSNIRKMEKRLETLEEDSEVDVPPELQLEPLSEAA